MLSQTLEVIKMLSHPISAYFIDFRCIKPVFMFPTVFGTPFKLFEQKLIYAFPWITTRPTGVSLLLYVVKNFKKNVFALTSGTKCACV